MLGIMSFTAFASNVSEPKATVLPDTVVDTDKCQIMMNLVSRDPEWYKEVIAGRDSIYGDLTFDEGEIDPDETDPDNVNYTDILACGIKTGHIPLWMVPFYIRWILEFIIGLAGLASVGGLVVGGYMYLFAGLSSDKEKGKNALKNAAIGLVLTLTAWAIVNIVLSLVTG